MSNIKKLKEFDQDTFQPNESDIRELTKFWEIWLENHPDKEISDSLQNQVYRLLRSHRKDIYQKYIEVQKTKPNSLENIKLLYGDQWERKYASVNKKKSENRRIKNEHRLDRFLMLKPVRNRITESDLTPEKKTELRKLLNYINDQNYHLNDNINIIIDLIRYYHSGFIERFNDIKSASPGSVEYFKSRYGDQWRSKYAQFKKSKQNDAYRNFKNTREYWLLKGLSNDESAAMVSDVQQKRNRRNREKNGSMPSPRSFDFWVAKGLSFNEAKDRIYQIQTRNYDFFVNKYGEEVGAAKFEKMIQARLLTQQNWSDEKRNRINKSKGRTYQQLVEENGIDVANEIMRRRLAPDQNKRISKESMDFFRRLDASLPPDIAHKSITGYKGKEKMITHDGRFFFVDYILGNNIIEYNGSYWHGDERLFSESDWHSGKQDTIQNIRIQDKERLDILRKLNYNILVIWSIDVITNTDQILTQCRDFLNANYQISNTNFGTI